MLAIVNYSYKKYQKELAKKKKIEEKKQRKLDKKNMQAKTRLDLTLDKCAIPAADSGQVSDEGLKSL